MFLSQLTEFVYKIFWRYYPFSLERLISKEIANYKTILDIGCGDGGFITRVKNIKNNYLLSITGCDIYKPYLFSAKNLKTYNNLIQCDIRKLPFKNDCFDTVLCIMTIEHLEKNEKYINNFENLAKHKIIITTSKGYVYNPEEKAVIYQRHLSGYTIDDFKNQGYIVRGLGCRIICGKWYKEGKIPLIIRPVFSFISLLLTLITYYYPNLAVHIICIKQKHEDKL